MLKSQSPTFQHSRRYAVEKKLSHIYEVSESATRYLRREAQFLRPLSRIETRKKLSAQAK